VILMMAWMRSPTRALSGITITVIAGDSVFSAGAGHAVRRLIEKIRNSKKRCRWSNLDRFCSDLAFTIPKKRVEIADKGAIGIKKDRVNAHAPQP